MAKDCGIVVLGAGCAGFGAAYALHEQGCRARVYEARSRVGGHTSTHFFDDGFTFDEGPHISFTSNRHVREVFADSIGGDHQSIKAYVNNYWQGHWIKHPAQTNLHGLPDDLVVSCIEDFVAASRIDEPSAENYEEWLLASFGTTFASTFPMQYTRKYHTTEARNLTTDWLGPRIYRPKLEEVLLGALKPEPLDVHYVDDFRYPTHGGFVAYLRQFEAVASVRCGHRVERIDPKQKTLSFANGDTTTYRQLISSVPLPELIPIIKGSPNDVVEAAEALSCSQVVLVNVGIDRPVETRAHWSYFYDDDFCFARLSYPARFSATLVPEGFGSIQAEIYFSKKWKPFHGELESWIEPTIDGLMRCGLVRDRKEVVHTSVLFAPYANVIFDHDRPGALRTVHGYLDDVGIGYCGRYGDWGYIWTDQAFISGERQAREALRRERSRR